MAEQRLRLRECMAMFRLTQTRFAQSQGIDPTLMSYYMRDDWSKCYLTASKKEQHKKSISEAIDNYLARSTLVVSQPAPWPLAMPAPHANVTAVPATAFAAHSASMMSMATPPWAAAQQQAGNMTTPTYAATATAAAPPPPPRRVRVARGKPAPQCTRR